MRCGFVVKSVNTSQFILYDDTRNLRTGNCHVQLREV